MGSSLAATLEGLKARFRRGVVPRPTTYYLSLGEAGGQKWTVRLSPTACEVVAGKVENADCVLKLPSELFVKLVQGTWKPGAVDFLSGRIKTNDIDLLRNLQTAFGL
ncbi:MAG TPA: SCP2 sterol-binding domain-containing protein [Polyangia bacterium]|nr:SCP2 sterol-binding domain-containing protein [Polyangia bacterium]